MNAQYGSYGSWLSQIQQAVTSYTPGGIAYAYARDQQAWLTERKVRTFADFRAMADWALEQAGKEKPAAQQGFDAARGQIKSIFPDQVPIPVAFDRLIQLLSSTPEIQRRVKVKKTEYQSAVVSKLSAESPSASSDTRDSSDSISLVPLTSESSTPWGWIVGGGVLVAVAAGIYFMQNKRG